MHKLRWELFYIAGISILLAACSSDPIIGVLNDAEGVPRKEKDRTVNWYKTKPELSENIKQACDRNTSKYFQRDDCINAKSALNLMLVESNTDLSNNLGLNEDRKYLKKLSDQ